MNVLFISTLHFMVGFFFAFYNQACESCLSVHHTSSHIKFWKDVLNFPMADQILWQPCSDHKHYMCWIHMFCHHQLGGSMDLHETSLTTHHSVFISIKSIINLQPCYSSHNSILMYHFIHVVALVFQFMF